MLDANTKPVRTTPAADGEFLPAPAAGDDERRVRMEDVAARARSR